MAFNNVGAARVPRSVFDLSHEKKLTCDMGELIPVLHDEMVPGDIFKMSNEVVLRFQPIVAPILHEVNVYVHYFFVPYRILWDGWEDFITGGQDGNDSSTQPTWSPAATTIGSLWDYFGFPVGITPTSRLPVDYPRLAYNKIYEEYYMDENVITTFNPATSEAVLKRAWEKDYFTSMLPWQQRGTPVALPISGTTSAEWPAVSAANQATVWYNSANQSPYSTGSKAFLENNTVDLSSATTFDVADLRLAFQIQKWMERNARAGVRYNEFILSHFGRTGFTDARLQRPEYIGGTKSPIIVSEVLQTSEDGTTPQGHMAGHGITADRGFVGKFRAPEFGIIMGIMSVMPRTVYEQGVNRQWLRQTRYDYYFPEFANLSEQAVEEVELVASNTGSENTNILGYQGRYDEMRVKSNIVCGEFRMTGNLDYWHLGRQFGSRPSLNQTFIECDPRKDIFAAPSEPGLLVNIGHRIKAVRPMPIISNPGLIDH